MKNLSQILVWSILTINAGMVYGSAKEFERDRATIRKNLASQSHSGPGDYGYYRLPKPSDPQLDSIAQKWGYENAQKMNEDTRPVIRATSHGHMMQLRGKHFDDSERNKPICRQFNAILIPHDAV